jgi:hypothetical protein
MWQLLISAILAFIGPFAPVNAGAALTGRPEGISKWEESGSPDRFRTADLLVDSAPQRRRSPVEGGSTYVVVGKTW